jgi:hypothetical protein
MDPSIEGPASSTGPQGIAAAGHGLQTSAYFRPWDPGLCIMPAHGSRELHRVPARMGLQLLAHGSIQGKCIEYRPAGDCSCWPWDPSIEGTALSTGPQGIAAAGPGIQGCAYCWPWDPSRELHRVPARRGLHHAGPWIHPSRKLHQVPARRGLHHASPVGVDHSMKLQPGPHGSNCQPSRSRSICRRSQLLAMGSRVVHHAGPWIYRGNCIEYRPGVDHSIEVQTVPHGSIEETALSPGPKGIASCWPGSESIDLPTFAAAGPGIQGCAYFRRVNPGNCIESRPAGDRNCKPARS